MAGNAIPIDRCLLGVSIAGPMFKEAALLFDMRYAIVSGIKLPDSFTCFLAVRPSLSRIVSL